MNVWKSNLNELETEVLDESSGLQKLRTQGAAAVRADSARGAARAVQKVAPRPGSSRGPSGLSKAGGSTAKIQNQSPVRETTTVTAPGGGVTGSGEELALTLEKVVSQLDIISRTLHVLEQRVSMNEESVANCLSYFREAREARQSGAFQQ